MAERVGMTMSSAWKKAEMKTGTGCSSHDGRREEWKKMGHHRGLACLGGFVTGVLEDFWGEAAGGDARATVWKGD